MLPQLSSLDFSLRCWGLVWCPQKNSAVAERPRNVLSH